MERSVSNLATQNKWYFSFTRIPALSGQSVHAVNNMRFHLTRCTLPGLDFTEEPINYQNLRTRVIHDPPEFQPIQVEFRVAEDWSNYFALLGWANYISNNRNNIALKDKDAASIDTTAFLEAYDAYDNPRFKFTYYHVILQNIGELTFDYQAQEEDLFCTASFFFDYFLFQRISVNV
jgi:hypothetical protein